MTIFFINTNEDIIALSKDYVEVTDVDTTYRVSLINTPGDETKEPETLKGYWYIDSGDKSCVELDTTSEGVLLIKGVKNGQLRVLCEYDGNEYYCDIVVNIDMTKVTLSKNEVMLTDTETGVPVYREYHDE